MAVIELKIKGYKCERCKHKWIPRNNRKPIICPKCKSAYWNRPRKNGARNTNAR